ncbi:MAG TPA: hypothetical protein VIG24_09375 [Acidimicrobiia bacterium]
MTYTIRNAEGQAVGRMTVTSPLGWVEPQHAHTFTTVTRDVLAIAAHFGGTIEPTRRGNA